MNYFQEIRQRVSAEDAARRYGLEFNNRGWCRCPFHGDQNPSMSFRQGRFHCWACNTSGDSIDLVGRLFDLKPLEALKKVDRDFGLCLPLGRDPTPEERQADRRRRELAREHKEFEEWRSRTIDQLNAAYRIGHEELKTAAALDDLTEATGFMSLAEYLSDTLAYGTAAEQMQIFRERRGVELRIQKILRGTPKKSGTA